MTSETIKLYKLIILYFLNRSKQDITNAILSDFILEYGYTDYFSIQETLAALTEDKMITVEQTQTSSYYSITEKGQEILNFFCFQLPKDTIQQIDGYMKEHKIQMVESTFVRTDYKKISPDEYLVRCKVMERGSILFETALSVSTEKEAMNVCGRFRKKSDIIYSLLLKELSAD